ncbi:hypothetical protein KSP40_PGU008358 [Platanthera guangdongensis]|uniref:Uncharacterized protein n=1 Tax=Platanthera guangdongensis TaxID=2320717 RepID=A0ABR2M748_9ASPA
MLFYSFPSTILKRRRDQDVSPILAAWSRAGRALAPPLPAPPRGRSSWSKAGRALALLHRRIRQVQGWPSPNSTSPIAVCCKTEPGAGLAELGCPSPSQPLEAKPTRIWSPGTAFRNNNWSRLLIRWDGHPLDVERAKLSLEHVKALNI